MKRVFPMDTFHISRLENCIFACLFDSALKEKRTIAFLQFSKSRQMESDGLRQSKERKMSNLQLFSKQLY